MNRKQLDAKLLDHFESMNSLALRYLEQEARKIMRQHPNCVEFIMGMGGWHFIDKKGNALCPYGYQYNNRQYFSSLTNFMEEWDSDLKLTGNPMRFTVDGPVRVDW